MASKKLEYRPVFASLRPPRLSYAYPIRRDWIHEARNANGVLASMWGGAGDILLPVNEKFVADVALLGLLRKFEPDYVGGHVATFEDLNHHDPQVKTTATARFAITGESPAQTWDRIRDESVLERYS